MVGVDPLLRNEVQGPCSGGILGKSLLPEMRGLRRNVPFLPMPHSFLLWILATWILLSTSTAASWIQTIIFCLEYSGVLAGLPALTLLPCTRHSVLLTFRSSGGFSRRSSPLGQPPPGQAFASLGPACGAGTAVLSFYFPCSFPSGTFQAQVPGAGLPQHPPPPCPMQPLPAALGPASRSFQILPAHSPSLQSKPNHPLALLPAEGHVPHSATGANG